MLGPKNGTVDDAAPCLLLTCCCLCFAQVCCSESLRTEWTVLTTSLSTAHPAPHMQVRRRRRAVQDFLGRHRRLVEARRTGRQAGDVLCGHRQPGRRPGDHPLHQCTQIANPTPEPSPQPGQAMHQGCWWSSCCPMAVRCPVALSAYQSIVDRACRCVASQRLQLHSEDSQPLQPAVHRRF